MTRPDRICPLCGAHGHLPSDCPWQEEPSIPQAMPEPILSALARERIEAELEGSDALYLEPRSTYDAAIVGIASRAGGMYVLAYDCGTAVQALMAANGWSEDEAIEWFEFNTMNAYVGQGTPVFLSAPADD